MTCRKHLGRYGFVVITFDLKFLFDLKENILEFVRIYRLQKVIRNLQRDGFFCIFKIRKSAGDHKFVKGN